MEPRRPEFLAIQPPLRVKAVMPGMQNAHGHRSAVFRLMWADGTFISVGLTEDQLLDMLASARTGEAR